MKAICTRCQGSGYDPDIETQMRGIDQYWKCNKCGMVCNFEPQQHRCTPKKPISKLDYIPESRVKKYIVIEYLRNGWSVEDIVRKFPTVKSKYIDELLDISKLGKAVI